MLELLMDKAGSKHLIDRYSVLQQIERYQKATSQQERDQLLYQIALSAEIFTTRELERIAKRGGMANEQRQVVLGYLEVYFNLNLNEN